MAALEPEPEPEGRRRAVGRGEGGSRSPPASPPAAAAAAMRSEPPAWPPVSAQAASLLEEAADLLVLHRDFAAAVERCEAGCDSLGPGSGPGPERCERVPGVRSGDRAALGGGSASHQRQAGFWPQAAPALLTVLFFFLKRGLLGSNKLGYFGGVLGTSYVRL